MNKFFNQIEMMERLSDIEKAMFVLSIVVEHPQTILDVSLTDPFEKKLFDEDVRTMTLTVKFTDDGSIRKSLIKHIEEVETNVVTQLDQIKKEKAKYE